MSSNHVFVSYSSADVDIALKLANELKDQGIKIWMDKISGLGVGDDWPRTLEMSLRDCCILLPVVTPRYTNSRFGRSELLRAIGLGKVIMPVLFEKGDSPLELERIQYLDFTEAAAYSSQLTVLIRHINTTCPSTNASSTNVVPLTAVVAPNRAAENPSSFQSVSQSQINPNWEQRAAVHKAMQTEKVVNDLMNRIDASYEQLNLTSDFDERLRIQNKIQHWYKEIDRLTPNK